MAWLVVLSAFALSCGPLPAAACTFAPSPPTYQDDLWVFPGPHGNLTIDSGHDTSEQTHRECESAAGPVDAYDVGPAQPSIAAGHVVVVGGQAFDVRTGMAFHAPDGHDWLPYSATHAPIGTTVTWQTTWAASGWLVGTASPDALAVVDLVHGTERLESLGTSSQLVAASGPRPIELLATSRWAPGAASHLRHADDGAVLVVGAFDLASGGWLVPVRDVDAPVDAQPVDASAGWILLVRSAANGTELWGLDLAANATRGPWPVAGTVLGLGEATAAAGGPDAPGASIAVVRSGNRTFGVRLADGQRVQATWPAVAAVVPTYVTRAGPPQPVGEGWTWVAYPVAPCRQPNPTTGLSEPTATPPTTTTATMTRAAATSLASGCGPSGAADAGAARGSGHGSPGFAVASLVAAAVAAAVAARRRLL